MAHFFARSSLVGVGLLVGGMLLTVAGCGGSNSNAPVAKPLPVEPRDAPADQSSGASKKPRVTTTAARSGPLKYPQPRREKQVDDYHGTPIEDPYRWLEDPNSDETKAWIKAENEVTFGWLEQVPEREKIDQRLTKLWDYEKFGVPTQRGGQYLYTRNDGLQNQSVLYVTTSLDSPPRELLDPNKLSNDGTVALTGSTLSDDGRLLAYGIASAGSDWQEWKVRDVLGAVDLDDHLQWIKFAGASWAKDGSGFFYSRYDEPDEASKLTGVNYYQKLFYHKLGTKQADDKLIYQRADEKEWGFDGQVTDDGRYLVVRVWRGTERKNQVFYADLEKLLVNAPSLASREEQAEGAGKDVVELITGWDAQYEFVDNDGPIFWFNTDHNAPRHRLIAVDTRQSEREAWKEIIPQAEAVLENVSVVGDRFFASYLQDASTRVHIFDLKGRRERELKLPSLGTASGFTGRRGDKETFYSFTSFTHPTTVYRYDIERGESSVFRAPKVPFNPDDYETSQVFYTSRDGTKVPMFITARRGTQLDGDNPTYLYGYGGFNIPLTPSFDVRRVVWLEMGGIYAMPNLRGGGEYGREWHEAGMKEKKQNVFDDFIAAAQYLIDKEYTSPKSLAIVGGSNGGLLVGACMTQRPDLFGAAIPKVGVMDMLRFQKFTIGWAWVSEYGSSDNADDFKNLVKYSPLQNIKPGTAYPATFIETADHDDRVVPAHSFKFAATLQSAQSGEAPVLIRIETSAGHGAGTPTKKLIDETTDAYAFLVRVFNMKLPEGF